MCGVSGRVLIDGSVAQGLEQVAEPVAVAIHRQEDAPVVFKAVPAGRRHRRPVVADGADDRRVRLCKEGEKRGRERRGGHVPLYHRGRPEGQRQTSGASSARSAECSSAGGTTGFHTGKSTEITVGPPGLL